MHHSAYDFAHVSDIGRRAENQDYMGHFFHENQALLLVADGLGGHKGGAIAAHLFTQYFIELMQPHMRQKTPLSPSDFEQITVHATQQMQQQAKTQNAKLDPRTTFVMAWITPQKVLSAHIGDSRFYMLRKSRVTHSKDHSLVQLLVKQGKVKPEDAGTHPDQHKLYRSIGSPKPTAPTLSNYKKLTTGEGVLLCSDGFWEYTKPAEIKALLDVKDLQQSLQALVTQAVQRGGVLCDNVTAQAIRLK